MSQSAAAALAQADDKHAVYKRITLRLIPFIFVCYLFNYLDRVNVGFAKLQMLDALKFSETVYGLGAGIFFIGYVLCGVPSNLALNRFGPRRWIALMMITWGTLSTCLLFVTTPTQFYTLRLFTGAAEAGFFPGVVLYLSQWFPTFRRGRIMALFMSAIPVSGLLGSPFSGWILNHFAAGQGGLAGWQWMFLLQGIPTVVLGALTGLPMFWPVPTALLSAGAAAGGLALINSMGQMAGFLSPYLVGWVKDSTGSTDAALYLLAGVIVGGSLLALRMTRTLNR